MLYCIDLKTNIIHVLGCPYIPPRNGEKNFLGRFDNLNDALIEAKFKGFLNANGCSHCCSSAHIK
ncbi:hypothetical protein [Psychrilyobacter sp.]|uniref:hypothetical protein n=1 Tax=Psychrilyobacter sp. TaxID=2586924 RepID=UPI00301679BF